MTKLSFMLVILSVLFAGCAGMDGQLQGNAAVNSLIWGTIGAGTGVAISAVTGGNIARGAVIGGLAGAGIGALNTPKPGTGYVTAESPYSLSYGPYYPAYREETERIRRDEYYRWQQTEKERGRNDARRDSYVR